MSLNNFTPEIWSPQLLVHLRKNLVFAQTNVINRNYQGEIQAAGDKVRIRSFGRVTIGDYSKNTDMAAAQTLTDSQTSLEITQSKYFNFQVDDIDKAQMDIQLMADAMSDAAYGLAEAADLFVAGMYVDAALAIGSDGSVYTPTTAAGTGFNDVYEQLVNLGVKLAENNVPTAGRWVICPPWFTGMLKKDTRFVGYGTDANRSVLLNGAIGNAAGFEILESNNVQTTNSGANYKITAGHPMAWTYADQISEVRAYELQQRFADALKGLHVYGAKVIRPEALCVLTAARPAGA